MLFKLFLSLSMLSLMYIGWQFRDVAFNGKPFCEFIRDPMILAAIAWLVITVGVVLYISYLEVLSYS